jgi:hypothetical protein
MHVHEIHDSLVYLASGRCPSLTTALHPRYQAVKEQNLRMVQRVVGQWRPVTCWMQGLLGFYCGRCVQVAWLDEGPRLAAAAANQPNSAQGSRSAPRTFPLLTNSPSPEGAGRPAGYADDAQHEHPGEGLVAILGVAAGQRGGQGRSSVGGGVALPAQLCARPPQP